MKLRTRNRWLTVIVVLLMLTLILPTAVFAGPPGPKDKDKHKAHTRTITVVSTNDFHGALVGRVQSWSHGDAVGGAEWLAGYLKIVYRENPRGFLYLDAGDIMQGTLISNYFDGASTIKVFNRMKLTAMTIGNHEFDWGQDVLADREHQARFPFLAANIFYKDTTTRPNWATPYIIKRINGVKVGIIGVATPETPSVTNPVNVADLDFTDPDDAVNDLIDEVEARGATVIIVVAHIGGFAPDYEEGIMDFACSLDSDEVDLVISGHTHSSIAEEMCGIPVVQAYSSGTAFSRVDLTVEKRTREVVEYTMNEYPVTTYQTYYGDPASYQRWDTGEWVEVVPDPRIAAIVDYYEAQIEDVMNLVLGETTTAITRDYRHESAMGDWVTDVMRAYEYVPGIDFALTNSGGLRADIDAGEITYGEVFETMPFDNTLVVVELDGNEVRQVLEEGITGDHGVVQVSGLQFTFDYDAPVGSRIVGDVIDISTGSPLEPATIYNVAVNDFMAVGGDDYATLAANPQVNTYTLVRDILVSWISSYSPFTPPDPAVEQRITVLGTPPL